VGRSRTGIIRLVNYGRSQNEIQIGTNIHKRGTKKEMKNKKETEMSDADYWKKYEETEEGSHFNNPIRMDILVKFKGFGDTELYEIKQKGISSNPEDLQIFLNNLKKIIRMLDESVIDKDGLI